MKEKKLHYVKRKLLVMKKEKIHLKFINMMKCLHIKIFIHFILPRRWNDNYIMAN